MKNFISDSEKQTIDAGRSFSHELGSGDVICLQGELGAGKTHFVKGLASGLGIDPQAVSSPTYTLINEYSGELPLYHFDCYRLKNEAEALDIGIEDYLYGEGISVIEWPQRVSNLIPEDAYIVTLEHVSDTKRKITIHQRDGS
ncbi:tRNA (adenosine(37)-N6)-threonylcarbamoyltransferase complex ATPase subunit type 1 TsaE [Balneola sp. MJW-20]|uniref:tRNA (adenosine(37)-N6)-threonylcarbamoyltransferase complex ATPase subunit type 1 TsaE n=1 Tax=Gracilimonas aurantiaca TaxID=3234185 RepID=UPI00346568AF